jgi:hypothetical protein
VTLNRVSGFDSHSKELGQVTTQNKLRSHPI